MKVLHGTSFCSIEKNTYVDFLFIGGHLGRFLPFNYCCDRILLGAVVFSIPFCIQMEKPVPQTIDAEVVDLEMISCQSVHGSSPIFRKLPRERSIQV